MWSSYHSICWAGTTLMNALMNRCYTARLLCWRHIKKETANFYLFINDVLYCTMATSRNSEHPQVRTARTARTDSNTSTNTTPNAAALTNSCDQISHLTAMCPRVSHQNDVCQNDSHTLATLDEAIAKNKRRAGSRQHCIVTILSASGRRWHSQDTSTPHGHHRRSPMLPCGAPRLPQAVQA
jgi:hypothetical protein